MNPNAKKLKDNFVKISLDHYDHQILLAHAEKAGVEVASLARELAMKQLHQIMFDDQPIAMILPARGKIELPLEHFFNPPKAPKGNSNNSSQMSMSL